MTRYGYYPGFFDELVGACDFGFNLCFRGDLL